MPVQNLITIVIGTRPEAIKLAPLIKEFKSCDVIDTRIVFSGQHHEMVEEIIELFQIYPDNDLKIMKDSQTLTHITCSILEGLKKDFQSYTPRLVIVQGDTATSLAAALAAFYEQIPVAHVEAGLRTQDIFDPFPEEVNRRLISQISMLNFAPTANAKENLRSANVLGEVYVTGNTGIDALSMVLKTTENISLDFLGIDWTSDKVILVTIHRREKCIQNLNNISLALIRILEHDPSIRILMPLHKNPFIRNNLVVELYSHPRVVICEPLGYRQLLASLNNCTIVLTDSGGMQEEAVELGKPVLILRKTTERIEALKSGNAKIVDLDQDSIFKETIKLLDDSITYQSMASPSSVFGDGNASRRIVRICREYLGI